MLSGAETQTLHGMVLDDGNLRHAAFWRQVVLAASENPAVINAWHTAEHDLARRFHADLALLQRQLAELPSNEEEVWVGTVEAVNGLIDTCDAASRRFEPRHKVIGGLAVAHVFYLCGAMQHALGFACTLLARERLAECDPEFTFKAAARDELTLTLRLLTTAAENYRKSEMAFAASTDIYTAILSFMEHVRRELAAQPASQPGANRVSGVFSNLGQFLKVGPGVVRVRDHFGDAALAAEVTASGDTGREALERASALRRECDEALTLIAERNSPVDL